MNRPLVNRIADAVLYEGYILYPYRPSVKNRQRWTFGGLFPEAFCRRQDDAWSNQTQCLVHGSAQTKVETTVRFLHLTDRVVGELTGPAKQWWPVPALRVGEQTYYPWQEAQEREIELAAVPVGKLLSRPFGMTFNVPGRRWLEPLRGPDGKTAGVLVRQQQPLVGTVELQGVQAADDLFQVTVRVANRTPLEDADRASRDDALLRALVSTHSILGVYRGEFVSLLDPPEVWRAAAAGCRNVGTYPVLVGEPGQRELMLSSPIILYDYPQVAPESPGDLFDGTEIDEILTLRILTLTDEEKRAAAAVDGRVREMLARTEALARQELMGLHGTVRGPGPLTGERQ
jgi:hydrogenase maturation protease